MTLRGDLRVNHRRIGEWWATRQPGTVDVHHYRWGVRVGSDWMYGELAHREADGAAVLAAKVLAASRAIPDANGLAAPDGAFRAYTHTGELLAEVDRLSHWKAEALPVIDGLQELGAELGIRLGGRITGPDALAAVKALTARAEAAEQAIQRVRDLAKYLSGLAGGDRHYADQILRALDGAS